MQHPLLEGNPLATCADLRRAMLDLWTPLRARFEANGAAVRLGDTAAAYGSRGQALEAFMRPLWGLLPLELGGGLFPDWGLYARGLAEGVDPGHDRYWGDGEDNSQRFVEMAALGLGLRVARNRLWDPLCAAVRSDLVAWLGQINRFRLPENNWLFFRVFANLGLRAVGASWDAARVRADLDLIDTFYRGDGWYADGDTYQRDYYIPMAMHFYGLLLAGLPGAVEPERAERYRERARRFAPDFAAWFAADGSAIPLGRSLTYRFAQGAFWGALAFAGVEALPWGVVKGLHLRHLRWWFRQPIFTDAGLLSLGYGYPNLIMTEGYNAPGSPYWACKAFLPLALPESHPFWRAEERPGPEPELSLQPGGGLLVCRDRARDHVVALSSNRTPGWPLRHAAEKYSKFAYSSAFGFGVSSGGTAPNWGAADGMLLLSEDGRDWRGREDLLEETYPRGMLHTRWAPWPDVEVETWLAPLPPGHVRVHRVRAGRPLRGVEGGFAVARPAGDAGIVTEVEGRAEADFEAGFSAMLDLAGKRVGRVLATEPNTNVLHPLVSVPVLEGELPAGESRLWTVVAGLPGAGQADAGRAFLAGLRLSFEENGPCLWRDDAVVIDRLAPGPGSGCGRGLNRFRSAGC